MRICETFRSIQGEIQGIGRQSFFIRTAGCNLGNKCPVDCDTRYSWDASAGATFHERNVEQLHDDIVSAGLVSVVITGGEPLLQQDEITTLVSRITGIDWFIETNGTIAPNDTLRSHDHVYFNVSPKLAAFDPAPFPLIRTVFKHVVTPGTSDLANWEKKMVSMPPAIAQRMYFMPSSRTRAQYLANAPIIAAWCNKCGFNFGPREHMVVFEGKRGL
jgi:7-carboxy-7-deazaguanine synthase